MSSLAKSILRDAVQKLLGIVFAWVGVHFVAIPQHDKDAITNWAVLAMTAGLLLVWTAAVRWLESRHGNNAFDAACRALGRILMLGIASTPVYVKPTPPAPPAPPADPVPAA